MRRLGTVAAVAAALVIPTGFAVAQGEEATVTRVTGTIISQSHSGPASSTTGGRVNHMLGLRAVLEIDWSDPRLPSTLTYVANLDTHVAPPDEIQTWAMRLRLDGADGYWTGSAYGMMDATSPEGLMVLTGEDGYDGLSAMLVGRTIEGGAFGYEGYVFEGELPALPGAIPAPGG